MTKIIIGHIMLLSGIVFGQVTDERHPSIYKSNPNTELNKIYENADTIAEFPGGINAFTQKLVDALKINSIKTDRDEKKLKATCTFVIEKDGTITDIKTSGENSSFNLASTNALSSIKVKWQPAKSKGVPVRSLYRLPLSLNFE